MLIVRPAAMFAQEQEDDFYKSIIKESINLDLIFEMEEMEIQSDSSSRGYITLDVNKKPLPHFWI